MKRLLLTLILIWGSTQAAPDTSHLTHLKNHLPEKEYHHLYSRYEAICLLIQTAPKVKQDELYLQLEKALLGNRSTEQTYHTLESFLSDTVAPHTFQQPLSRYWHPNILSLGHDESKHLSSIWKILTFAALCGAGYLVLTFFRNNIARKAVDTFERDSSPFLRRAESFARGTETVDQILSRVPR